ncbi:MAG: hypothetical protein ACUVUC_07160 [Thermoguttaceae bacterium]
MSGWLWPSGLLRRRPNGAGARTAEADLPVAVRIAATKVPPLSATREAGLAAHQAWAWKLIAASAAWK